MPPVRNRRESQSVLYKGDVEAEKRKREKANRTHGFSDDEDVVRDDKASVSSSQFSLDALDSRSPGPNYAFDSDEVENDVEMFNKAVSGNHPVDHRELLSKMHTRFKKKALKWEAMAKKYDAFSFALNFALLIFPVLQMMLCQTKDLVDFKMIGNTGTIKSTTVRKSMWQKMGISSNSNANKPQVEEVSIVQPFITVELLQCVLAVMTALVAGLQLKLKLREKAEKYKKGAKAYGKLLRMSSYYSMITESGGRIDDVTGLWREAMIRENKEVPCIRTFTAV